MHIGIELKKLRRTGFIPTFILGGILCAMVPVLQTAVRSDTILQQKGTPVGLLLDSNWQMIAMLHSVLIVIGACVLYHLEMADRGRLKMDTLPMREETIFFSKCTVLVIGMFYVIFMEALGFLASVRIWFPESKGYGIELGTQMGLGFLAVLPVTLVMLWIASCCSNLWISLGIGIIGMFTATILRGNHLITALYPFSLLYLDFTSTDINTGELILGILLEIIFIGLGAMLYEKTRGKDR